jgi:hypothetical protein
MGRSPSTDWLALYDALVDRPLGFVIRKEEIEAVLGRPLDKDRRIISRVQQELARDGRSLVSLHGIGYRVSLAADAPLPSLDTPDWTALVARVRRIEDTLPAIQAAFVDLEERTRLAERKLAVIVERAQRGKVTR